MLFVPVLLLAVGLEAHHAVGTVVKGLNNQVSITVTAVLLITSTTGVQIGTWLCMKLSARRLQKYFAIVVLLTAVIIGINLIKKLCHYS